MEDCDAHYVHVSQLRIGMFVQLDIGWMEHPFPIGSFKIASVQQIETIRALGLNRIRYLPGESEVAPWPASQAPATVSIASEPPPPAPTDASGFADREGERQNIQQRNLLECERRHDAAMLSYTRIFDRLATDPAETRAEIESTVAGCVGELLESDESSIRLLPAPPYSDAAFHSVNVMVFSLLLGKARGMLSRELLDLGMAALLHDIGAEPAPANAAAGRTRGNRPPQTGMSPLHVANGVAAAQQLGLPQDAVRAIAEHHELVDGNGFPSGLRGDEMSTGGKILSLVNCWENLCNPAGGEPGLSPYDTLSTLFGPKRAHFDPAILGSFIRMLGLYPPGSLVQLADDRHALVTAVDSSRPLRPQVIVYDPAVPRADAVLVDLERSPELAIRRALKAEQLPAPALQYLQPPRLCRYFFDGF